MSTHARALGTDMAVEAHLDVGDTAKATRKHHSPPPIPRKNPPVQLSYPLGTLLAGFWAVSGESVLGLFCDRRR